MFDAVGDSDVAAAMAGRWSGRAVDTSIAAEFLYASDELIRGSDPDDAWTLTTGTLRAVPDILMGDGDGHVAVLTRISGTHPRRVHIRRHPDPVLHPGPRSRPNRRPVHRRPALGHRLLGLIHGAPPPGSNGGVSHFLLPVPSLEVYPDSRSR